MWEQVCEANGLRKHAPAVCTALPAKAVLQSGQHNTSECFGPLRARRKSQHIPVYAAEHPGGATQAERALIERGPAGPGGPHRWTLVCMATAFMMAVMATGCEIV